MQPGSTRRARQRLLVLIVALRRRARARARPLALGRRREAAFRSRLLGVGGTGADAPEQPRVAGHVVRGRLPEAPVVVHLVGRERARRGGPAEGVRRAVRRLRPQRVRDDPQRVGDGPRTPAQLARVGRDGGQRGGARRELRARGRHGRRGQGLVAAPEPGRAEALAPQHGVSHIFRRRGRAARVGLGVGVRGEDAVQDRRRRLRRECADRALRLREVQRVRGLDADEPAWAPQQERQAGRVLLYGAGLERRRKGGGVPPLFQTRYPPAARGRRRLRGRGDGDGRGRGWCGCILEDVERVARRRAARRDARGLQREHDAALAL